MPKKPNSHGNDQEYVPAGNGDASGEYADEGGSNKGFKSFKVPGSTTSEKGGIVVEPNKTDEKYESFDDYVEKSFKGGKNFTRENLKDSFNAGSAESMQTIDHFIQTGDITYKSVSGSSCYSPSSKIVEMNINNDDVFVGETFYHESGHAIDYALGTDEEQSVYFFRRTVRKTLSETKITENGKTLNDTLRDEMREMGVGGWQAVIDDYTATVRDNAPKYPDGYEEKKQEYNKETEGLYKKAMDEATRITKQRYEVWDRGWNRAFDKEYERQKSVLMSDRAKELRGELDKIEKQHALDLRTIKSPFDTLSDMYGAYAKKSYGFANCGHSATYFRERPEGKAHEFFAEYFSARSINDSETIAKLKQYMPQSSKACEELYQYAISQR